MPNWCNAYAGILGTKEDILRFLNEEITWEDKYSIKGEMIPFEPHIVEEGEELKIFKGEKPVYTYNAHLKSSNRHFVNIEAAIPFEWVGATTERGEIYEISLSMEIAWGPDREYFKLLAERYNFRIELDTEEGGAYFHGYGVIDKDTDTYEEYDLDEWRKTKRYELFPGRDFSLEEQSESEDKYEEEDYE